MTDEKKPDSTSAGGVPDEKSPKESKVAKICKNKRTPITIGVVVVVILLACIGGFVWHEQPSFCNAICHTPMDGYLQTYEAKSGSQATDKWGNTVSGANGMMAAVHRDKAKTNCLGCHQPVLDEQVSEGVNWITGNYYAPLSEKKLTELTKARKINSQQFCMNQNCHNLSYDVLAKKTSNMTYNPHETHYDGLECGDCHKAHRASVYYCTKCHDAATADMPEGWITYAESQQLEKQHATQE